MNTTLETMWRTYETINQWIQTSNTKAEIILGIHGIMVSIFLTSDLIALKTYLVSHPSIYITLVLIILSSTVSIASSIRCLNPRLDVGAPQSLIFFAHIAQKFDQAPSYERSVREEFLDKDQLLHDIASQVWANSVVAEKKFTSITWAIRWLACTISLGVVAVILILLVS